MTTITQSYAAHHSRCDGAFADAEALVARGDWDAAARAFRAFEEDMEVHFKGEEETLFPAFEARTGVRGGPTAMMRLEHTQMRALLARMRDALAAKDADAFAGAAETMLILMQQHNMKEEQILYPMCDRALGADAALVHGVVARLGRRT